MSKVNALSGLIGNYGDSDDESDDAASYSRVRGLGNTAPVAKSAGSMNSSELPLSAPDPSAAIHPAPVAHCPWSACYDETSGFTYYWNQQTNAVTWEAPPEYLLALKLAQQHLHTARSTEVSAEEWQLYQQALAEKQNTQNKVISKPATVKPAKKTSHTTPQNSKKRRISDEEDVKIELITSYHNSDSESNDEESPVKATPVVTPKVTKVPVAKPPTPKLPATKAPATKVPAKKPKKNHKVIEYGPQLPPNQNYSIPIGPELPPELVSENTTTVKENNVENSVSKVESIKSVNENEDSQDESLLLTKLKDKAKILEKLGGELPVELQKIIEETTSESSPPPLPPDTIEEKSSVTKSVIDTNIDDLLEEIEKKELPKIAKSKAKIDMFSNAIHGDTSPKHSPKPPDDVPSEEVVKPLFPSSQNITDEPPTVSLFPSANSQELSTEKDKKEIVAEKKTNVYLMDPDEGVENVSRKKLRISNSILPAKKSEAPAYTTKYSQFIEGFTTERTGLGFSKDDEETNTKNTVSYGNGLLFTKGETLHDEKKEDDLQDLTDLLGMKLKFLNQLQPCNLSPVQEMLIQMQTLSSAFSAGGVTREYWWKWARAAAAALARHEAAAAPPGWRAAFLRSEGRYRYERESDGLVQWEYPADANMDMDICTTPPHPGSEPKEESVAPLQPVPPPPAPVAPPLPPPPPPPPRTPPPPTWDDPPPPGCDDAPPPPLPPEPEIGDELQSFYNDIAELEKQTISAPTTASNSPEPPLPEEREKDKVREKDKDTKTKKKSKVKISSAIGMKQKSVSSLVAKWQQVAEEINSD